MYIHIYKQEVETLECALVDLIVHPSLLLTCIYYIFIGIYIYMYTFVHICTYLYTYIQTGGGDNGVRARRFDSASESPPYMNI